MYKKYFKRIIDLTFSTLIFIVILPAFILIIVILSIYYLGNPFFTQERPGLNGEIFNLLKFRSMLAGNDADGNLLPDSQRITGAGRFIRKTSIDELPQLINIFLGHMSFIGPRPLLTSYLAYYTEREHKRHCVKPGISGLAQVSGRNNVELPRRLELDIEYVETLSFKNDCIIAYKTVKNVLSGKDITVVTPLTELKDYRNKNPNWKGI